MNQHLDQPQQPQQGVGHHFSLPSNTLFKLLLTEKASDERIQQIKAKLFGVEVDEQKTHQQKTHQQKTHQQKTHQQKTHQGESNQSESNQAEVDETKSLLEEMHLSLLIIVLQCMGMSQDWMWRPVLDVWFDTEFDNEDSERSQARIRCFLTWVYREFHAYYQSNLDETVAIRKRESVLVYVLKRDFNWRTSIARLQSNGLPPHLLDQLRSINLLPIVFAELNTQYLEGDLEEVSQRISTGSEEECLRCLEWIQTLGS